MFFLVLLVLALEAYHHYRLNKHEGELAALVEELKDLKETTESELASIQKSVRAGGAVLKSRPSRGKGSKNSPIRVERRVQEYWQKQGWERKNGSFTGYYRTPVKSFKGEVSKNGNGFEYWIYNLPRAVKGGNHGSCFTHKGGGRYRIHFGRNPRDLSAGIMAVERILRESLDS